MPRCQSVTIRRLVRICIREQGITADADSGNATFEAPGAIQKFCKSATDENVLAECHQVGAAMRAGDSIMTNVAGIAISSYGLPAESAEARSLVQEERRIRWTSRAR